MISRSSAGWVRNFRKKLEHVKAHPLGPQLLRFAGTTYLDVAGSDPKISRLVKGYKRVRSFPHRWDKQGIMEQTQDLESEEQKFKNEMQKIDRLRASAILEQTQDLESGDHKVKNEMQKIDQLRASAIIDFHMHITKLDMTPHLVAGLDKFINDRDITQTEAQRRKAYLQWAGNAMLTKAKSDEKKKLSWWLRGWCI